MEHDFLHTVLIKILTENKDKELVRCALEYYTQESRVYQLYIYFLAQMRRNSI